MTFPLPSGPMAYVIALLVLFGLISLAICRRNAIKRAKWERHEGFDSVVDQMRKRGSA